MSYAQKMLYDKKQKLMADIKAGVKVRLLEADFGVLEQKCNQQIKEMELVRWYTEVMEQGVDATRAMKNYAQLKQKCETIEKLRAQEKSKYESQINILQVKLKENQQQLKKQHFEVTKPLI